MEKKCVSLRGTNKLQNMTHLTEKQRYEIYVKQQNSMNYTQIANAIGVNKSTINRKVRRNCDKRDDVYKPDLAQRKYEQRRNRNDEDVV